MSVVLGGDTAAGGRLSAVLGVCVPRRCAGARCWACFFHGLVRGRVRGAVYGFGIGVLIWGCGCGTCAACLCGHVQSHLPVQLCPCSTMFGVCTVLVRCPSGFQIAVCCSPIPQCMVREPSGCTGCKAWSPQNPRLGQTHETDTYNVCQFNHAHKLIAESGSVSLRYCASVRSCRGLRGPQS